MRKDVDLSEREELVMCVLWKIENKGEKNTCKEVIKILKEEYDLNFEISTVYTFLDNLRKKGYLKKEKKGVNYYTTLKTKDEYLEKVLNRLNKLFCSGNKKEFIKKVKLMDI